MTKFVLVGHPVRVARQRTADGTKYVTVTLRCRVSCSGGRCIMCDIRCYAWGDVGESLRREVNDRQPARKLAVSGRIVSTRAVSDRGYTPHLCLNVEEWEWAELSGGYAGLHSVVEDRTIPQDEIDDTDEIGGVEVKW